MSTKEELAREGLEAAFQSVITKFKPGDYVATIKGVELIDSTRGISVAVKFEI